jgi:tetratricopeptide (TPR) repeat protein
MRRFHCGFVFLILIQPAFGVGLAASEQVQIVYLQQVDAAIREGRLTQAELMIAKLDRSDGIAFSDDLALLKTEFAIARMDVTSAGIALSAIKDPARNTCRVHAAKGWVAANQKDFDAAVSALMVATKHCPEDAGNWNLLGLALIGRGEASSAQKAFEQAIALEPQNAQVMNNHALAALQGGAVDVALRGLDRAVAQNPHDTMIIANRNFVAGMAGVLPERENGESNADWGAKLLQFARGAKLASRGPQATALFARAMLTLDRFDEGIWSELYPAVERPR